MSRDQTRAQDGPPSIARTAEATHPATLPRRPEPSGLSQEELRRIVLDLLG